MRLPASTVLFAATLSMASAAAEAPERRPKDIFPGSPVSPVEGAATGYPSGVRPGPISTPQLQAIIDWLTREYALPAIEPLPEIALASVPRMVALRQERSRAAQPAGFRADLLAIYDDDTRTVYLPLGWRADTPADLSLLVHEVMHHVQNVGGEKFACPEERERAAFDAQERWLNLFGSDLETAFGIDAMTRLARSSCFY